MIISRAAAGIASQDERHKQHLQLSNDSPVNGTSVGDVSLVQIVMI
jgi:hypothetical protein